MSFPLSRIMSAATACYGVYALAQPGHLASAMKVPSAQKPAWDLMAYTYAARDLPVSAAGMWSSSPQVVTTAMVLRILGDLSDATILGLATDDEEARTKALTATLGWAGLNTVALVIDRRRYKKKLKSQALLLP
ncbi:MAG: hypothetical protein H0U62_02880 [Actinobacteria bacterium]|nr:hypothetical protein [Actinomycetota bacterium]